MEERDELLAEIEALKKENHQLSAQLEENSQLIRGLPDLMFTLTREGVFTDYAVVGLSLYRSPEQFLGRSLRSVVPESLANVFDAASEEAITTGRRQTITYTLPHDDEIRHYEARLMRCCGGDGVVAFVRDITRTILVEEALRTREKELEKQTQDLEEMNTALEVLLEKRSRDKKALEEEILFTVREMIHPWLEKLKHSRLGDRQMAYLEVIESNLNTIAKPLLPSAPSYQLRLTPSEVEVANLIREGKTNKEMAEMLSLSVKTIETHRKNIRRKLGITHSKTNLRSLLVSADSTLGQ